MNAAALLESIKQTRPRITLEIGQALLDPAEYDSIPADHVPYEARFYIDWPSLTEAGRVSVSFVGHIYPTFLANGEFNCWDMDSFLHDTAATADNYMTAALPDGHHYTDGDVLVETCADLPDEVQEALAEYATDWAYDHVIIGGIEYCDIVYPDGILNLVGKF